MSDKTREQELRAALGPAKVPGSVYRLVSRLIDRADWKTGLIPDKFQFRAANGDRGGYDALARYVGLPRATVIWSIEWAEDHGWLEVTRPERAGRGLIAKYQPQLGGECAGSDCGCRASRAAAKRRKGTNCQHLSPGQKGTNRYDLSVQKGTNGHPGKVLTGTQESPGQPTFSTGGQLEGGVGGASRAREAGDVDESTGEVLIHRCRLCRGPLHIDLWDSGVHERCAFGLIGAAESADLEQSGLEAPSDRA